MEVRFRQSRSALSSSIDHYYHCRVIVRKLKTIDFTYVTDKTNPCGQNKMRVHHRHPSIHPSIHPSTNPDFLTNHRCLTPATISGTCQAFLKNPTGPGMIIYSKLFSHKKVHRVARFNPFPAVLPFVFRGPQNTILRKRFFIQLFFCFRPINSCSCM